MPYKLKSGEMFVRGNQWLLFLYKDCNFDPENPWKGLLQHELLVLVHCRLLLSMCTYLMYLQAYKHVFTSPSSVDCDDPKATRSGNAHIHGMTSVTIGSLAYIATQVSKLPTANASADPAWQVCFALSSAGIFSRSDMIMDLEQFYTSLFDILKDPREKKEVDDLLGWWNR